MTEGNTITGPGAHKVTVEGDGNGKVTVMTSRRFGGEVYVLNTGDGPIKIATGRGNVKVLQYDDNDTTTSDAVSVMTNDGEVDVMTNGGGEVDVTTTDGEVDVQTYGGKVTIKNLGDKVRVLNHSGFNVTIWNNSDDTVTVILPTTDPTSITVEVGGELFASSVASDEISINLIGGVLIVNDQAWEVKNGGITRRSKGNVNQTAHVTGGTVYQAGGDIRL
jgi:hypothetical protein